MCLPKVQKRFELQFKDNVAEHKMSFGTEMSSSNTRSFISNAKKHFQSALANNNFKHCWKTAGTKQLTPFPLKCRIALR